MKTMKWNMETRKEDDDWTKCPTCGSDQIEGSSIDIVGATAQQTLQCSECNALWHEVYHGAFRVIETEKT